MYKNIWIITHDNHIDHRTLFVAKSLIQQGAKVKLFAGECFSIFDDDQDFVVRPYNRKLDDINCLFGHNNIQSHDSNELKFIESIVKNFNSIKADPSKIIQKKIDIYQCIRAVDDEGIVYLDIFNIKTKKHFYWNSHNKEINEIVVPDSVNSNMALLYYYDKKMQLEFNHQSLLNKFYDCGLISKEEEKNFSFYKNRIYTGNSRNYAMIDLDHNSLLSCSTLSRLQNGNIEFQGKQFFFDDFCQDIYDFTPIFQSVCRFIDEKPDVVYVTDLPTLPIGYILKETLQAKLIIDCHEWWMGQLVLWEPKATKKMRLIDKYEKYLYSACDKRITVGEHLAKLLHNYFSLPFEYFYTVSDHLVSSPNIGMLDNDRCEKEEFWYSRFGIPKDAKVCIFQGSLTTNRNIENLVKSIECFDNNHYLVIVGNGSILSMLQSIAEKLNKKKQVLFIGWVGQEELLNFSINADVGIIPYVAINEYYATSVPNKLSEYYAANLPILADSSMKEICSNITKAGIGLVVDCVNPSVLGHKISRLLNDNNLLKTIKKNYQKKLEAFDEEVQKQKVLDILL